MSLADRLRHLPRRPAPALQESCICCQAREVAQQHIMPKAAGPSEADLVFNRVSLQLAQLSQKLLGPRGDGGPTTYEALEDESEDVFTADAELYVPSRGLSSHMS